MDLEKYYLSEWVIGSRTRQKLNWRLALRAKRGVRSFRSGTSRTASTTSSARSRSGTRTAVEAAVRASEWKDPYYVDADHIDVETVDRFLDPCDFFTLDVAYAIGHPAGDGAAEALLRPASGVDWLQSEISGIEPAAHRAGEDALRTAAKYSVCRDRGRAKMYRGSRRPKGTGTSSPKFHGRNRRAQTPPNCC